MARVNYFAGVQTLEDVKDKLIENLKAIDPKSPKFKTMMKQYENAYNAYNALHHTKAGKVFQKPFLMTPEKWAELSMKMLAMDGVKLERSGRWYRATGETKPKKEELKALGFFWNGKVWQWHDVADSKYYKGGVA